MLGFPRDIKVGISNTIIRYAVVWGCLGRLSREAGGPQKKKGDDDHFLTGGERKGGSTKAGSFLQLKM